MKPRILLTPSLDEEEKYSLRPDYCQAVRKAGGMPLIMPFKESELISDYLSLSDGILFSGGNDPDPLIFAEEPHPAMKRIEPGRDMFERKMLERALKLQIPVLGICKGFQLMNMVLGGSIYQDIESELSDHIKHMQQVRRDYPTHSAHIVNDSLAAKILGTSSDFAVNSFHHQAIKELSDELTEVVAAPDGLVEMAVSLEYNLFGVQWHPEMLEGSAASEQIFDYFISSAQAS